MSSLLDASPFLRDDASASTLDEAAAEALNEATRASGTAAGSQAERRARMAVSRSASTLAPPPPVGAPVFPEGSTNLWEMSEGLWVRSPVAPPDRLEHPGHPARHKGSRDALPWTQERRFSTIRDCFRKFLPDKDTWERNFTLIFARV